MFKGLAVVSFVMLCWVFHRGLEVRTTCLNSRLVTELKADKLKLDNCQFESRLTLQHIIENPSIDMISAARRLEKLDSLAAIWPNQFPKVQIELDSKNPFNFELRRGFVRIGTALAQADGQLERGTILGLLHTHFGLLRTPYENEVTADFLMINVLGIKELQDPSTGDRVNYVENSSFALTPRNLNEYCNSTWRSLTHFILCSVNQPGKQAHDVSAWGTRPLLAKILSRIYEDLSIGAKVEMMSAVFSPEPLPVVSSLADESAVSLALWTVEQSKSFLRGWNLNPDDEATSFSLKKALMREKVFHTTQWDYTVEIANSAQWDLLWRSLKSWSKLHPTKKILVWSPIGAFAFPEGMPVEWDAHDVKTQKHVLLACEWPSSDHAKKVEARHFVALQVCNESQAPIWSQVLTPEPPTHASVSF